MVSAYGTLANGGVRMPPLMLLEVYDANGQQVWPATDGQSAGDRVVSPQTAFILSDILAGNTQDKVNPYWAEWKITDGKEAEEIQVSWKDEEITDDKKTEGTKSKPERTKK